MSRSEATTKCSGWALGTAVLITTPLISGIALRRGAQMDGAIRSITEMLGIGGMETLSEWVRQAEIDDGAWLV